MTFKAMVLDERGVYVAKVELEDGAEIPPRHVDLRPLGGDCDRPFGQYRWNLESRCLEPLPRQQRAVEGRPTLEQAIAFDLLGRWERAAASVPDVTLAWLDDRMTTVDFSAYVRGGHPLITKYMEARGILPRAGGTSR